MDCPKIDYEKYIPFLEAKLSSALEREKLLEEALTFYSDCDMCDQCEDLNDDEDGGYDASYTAREALSRVKAMRDAENKTKE